MFWIISTLPGRRSLSEVVGLAFPKGIGNTGGVVDFSVGDAVRTVSLSQRGIYLLGDFREAALSKMIRPQSL